MMGKGMLSCIFRRTVEVIGSGRKEEKVEWKTKINKGSKEISMMKAEEKIDVELNKVASFILMLGKIPGCTLLYYYTNCCSNYEKGGFEEIVPKLMLSINQLSNKCLQPHLKNDLKCFQDLKNYYFGNLNAWLDPKNKTTGLQGKTWKLSQLRQMIVKNCYHSTW